MEKPDHPTPVRSEWLQELEHLLVGSPIPPGEMVDDHVLEVEVARRHLVGIAVGHLEGLRRGPVCDPAKRTEEVCSRTGLVLGQGLDSPGVPAHLPDQVGASLLQMERVEQVIGSVGERIGVRGKPKVGIRPGCRTGELAGQPLHRPRGFVSGDLLPADGDQQRGEHEVGPPEPVSGT